MAKRSSPRPSALSADPLWYKDAIIYELHVRAFADSNGDGIGDFPGLTSRLPYLQDLGVTALWLLPFCPSPLRDDGYDIAAYTDIHPDYGTLKDFKAFLKEAHRRGIRVITELVLNHTSDQHPWFQRARRAKPGERWRDFYVWSETNRRYQQARIIFEDFETSNWTWDPMAGAYFWHRFYSHQPDLNYDNPRVRKAVFKVLDFWLGLGVDGLRLDAVPYLFQREGTNCENLPETYAFLKELRSYVDSRYEDRMLLAEANQWPEDAVAYFGDGDECHMAYHFPLMPRLFMALQMEDRFPVIDILDQTPEIPSNCQWALFLRNHDELTLEMVTDEERDYMYRAYAEDTKMRINQGIRRRLAPLLANHRRRIELMNGLLLSLPGSPTIYYGDEIGMGDNFYLGDRNGVRTPMQWSPDRNAGFSAANPQRLYLPVIIDPEYHYETLNVESQQNNVHSLLWWMKRLVALRKQFRAFGRGTIEFLHPENRKVLVFVRRYQEERILVVVNLSRFAQFVELDLSAYKEMVPVEIFGRTEFPPIGELPYLLTMGPHSFFWFLLTPRQVTELEHRPGPRLPDVPAGKRWESVFEGRARAELEKVLPDYLRARRWFGGKARHVKSVRIVENIPVTIPQSKPPSAFLAFIRVDYVEGDPDTYVLPLTFAVADESTDPFRDGWQAVAWIKCRGGPDGVLYDAVADERFAHDLLQAIGKRRQLKGRRGQVLSAPTRVFRAARAAAELPLTPSVVRAEQSNTSVLYGNTFILKLFRRVQHGVNPDLEIGRFLTDKGFAHVPQVAGAIEYQPARGDKATLAILQRFVPNQGDAWEYTLDVLKQYQELALTQRAELEQAEPDERPLLELVEAEQDPELWEMVGSYRESARVLGQRTAEMHLALASETEDPAFAPEPVTKLYRRSLYQSTRGLTGQVMQALRKRIKALPEEDRAAAERLLERRQEILQRFRAITEHAVETVRIRCHGDYHLGQVLYTGRDFVIIDFEGEPARPVSERRIKRTPLRDVAGMLRSFHYAVRVAVAGHTSGGLVPDEERETLERAADLWHRCVCTDFLRSYFEVAAGGGILPSDRVQRQVLLDVYLLEKAIYELGYELNNRPGWVRVPIAGIEQVLAHPTAAD